MYNAGEIDRVLVSSALDLVESGVLVIQRGGFVTVYNQAAREILGAQPTTEQAFLAWEQASGFHTSNGKKRVAVEDLPWRRAFRAEFVQESDYFLRNAQHRSGLYVAVNAKPDVGADDGSIQRVIVSIADISARRRAEQALRSSRRLTRVLFDESQAAVLRTTVDGRILACNKSLSQMLGYDNPKEIATLRSAQIHMPGAHEEMVAKLLKDGPVREQELQLRCKDGSRRYTLASAQLMEPGPEEFEHSIVTTLVDVTDYRRAQSAVRNSEQRFAEFMRHIPGVVFIKDTYGRYLFLSESASAMMGVDPVPSLGKTDYDLFPPEYADVYRASDREVLSQHGVIRSVVDVPVGNVLQRWTVYKFPIPDETGELTLVGGIGVDESERAKLEARLQEIEKMDAIGRVAGLLAHDFNNLLTVISGYGQMLQDALNRKQPQEKVLLYLNEMMGASGRAAKLTDQLLAFSRKQHVNMQRIDLCKYICSLENMLRSLLGEQIELVLECSPEPCFVRADTGHLEQLAVNLALNARDACPNGGRFLIRTAFADNPPAGLPDLKAKQYVLLQVADTGVGIDESIRDRIFEPFFTSKPKGKGTGLGLSTVYGIVKQTGGEIFVHSERGHGTTFDIYLPAFEGAAPPPQLTRISEKPEVAALRGSETVLLVEDDDTVRNLVKAMLERYGYKTLVAEGPREALNLYQERGREVKLLLTDVIMPHMSGRILALTLRRAEPTLRILYMSGYTAEEIATQGVVDATYLIRKPFTAEALIRRVRDVLDAPVAPN